MGDLEGKVAVVTGAGSGIGEATAVILADRGAFVVAADINGGSAEATAARVREGGGTAIGVVADVSKEEQVAAMIASAVGEFGGLDIIHNNAAAVSAEVIGADLEIADVDPALFRHVLDVNLIGYALGAKHAIPEMRKRGQGVIVNTASDAGFHGEYVRPMYSASKAAVMQMTKSIATRYGQDKIRCVAVAPGIILTPAAAKTLTEETISDLIRHTPIERGGTPEDVGELVAFLASDRASFITGVAIPVDGGFGCHAPHFADERDASRN